MLGALPCAGGAAALKPEASKIAEIDARVAERMIRSAPVPEELFCRFFIFVSVNAVVGLC